SRRRRAVGGGVSDRHRLAARGREADREGQVVRAGIALAGGGIINRDRGRRVIVDDRADGLPIAEGGVGRGRQVEEERLIRLVEHIAQDRNGDGLGGRAERECERTARHGVIDARRRRAVGGGI